MKVTGFSFIRNGLKYDYPIVEAITSILPICDEFVVAVGKSEDETYDLINNIDKEKIKIIETEWDDSLREGGKVLARYEQSAREFLYPTPTLTGKDGMDRELLLSRTIHFTVSVQEPLLYG